MYNNLIYRFDLEVCKSRNGEDSTSPEDIINCIPGKFGIFCYSTISINEQILKAAGLLTIVWYLILFKSYYLLLELGF